MSTLDHTLFCINISLNRQKRANQRNGIKTLIIFILVNKNVEILLTAPVELYLKRHAYSLNCNSLISLKLSSSSNRISTDSNTVLARVYM